MEFTKYLIIRKSNKPDILFCLIFSMVFPVYIKMRWFFTHNVLLIFLNLRSIELESLFFKKFKFK